MTSLPIMYAWRGHLWRHTHDARRVTDASHCRSLSCRPAALAAALGAAADGAAAFAAAALGAAGPPPLPSPATRRALAATAAVLARRSPLQPSPSPATVYGRSHMFVFEEEQGVSSADWLAQQRNHRRHIEQVLYSHRSIVQRGWPASGWPRRVEPVARDQRYASNGAACNCCNNV